MREMQDTERDIRAVCNEIADMLVNKNRSYGDSAMNPVRIFSRAPVDEQLNVRMDDKLSRLAHGDTAAIKIFGEDVEKDLLGYLILKQVSLRRHKVAVACTVNTAQPPPKLKTAEQERQEILAFSKMIEEFEQGSSSMTEKAGIVLLRSMVTDRMKKHTLIHGGPLQEGKPYTVGESRPDGPRNSGDGQQ